MTLLKDGIFGIRNILSAAVTILTTYVCYYIGIESNDRHLHCIIIRGESTN